MSEALTLLKRLYKEVSNLYRDCAGLADTIQDWNQHVSASETLGNDSPVEAWYLAEHFLLAFSDWSGLMLRYHRYFGKSSDEFPKAWGRLNENCWILTLDLLSDESLSARLQHWWIAPEGRRPPNDETNRPARFLYHSLINDHRRAMCIAAVSEPLGTLFQRESISRFDGPSSRNLSGEQYTDFGQYTDAFRTFPGDLRDELVTHLQHYRHANLIVSWLFAETNERPVGSPFYREFLAMPHSFDHFLDSFNLDHNYRVIVDRVLRRVQSVISELGYDNFVDDITSKELVSGSDNVIGAQGVNVIPGYGPEACSPIVLAVAKGEKRLIGFPSIMKQVREHLIRCIDTTKVVVVICDHWRTDMLVDHLGDLRAHHARGVRFLFLLAASPGNSVSAVAVHFG